jgi:hypothetical protein
MIPTRLLLLIFAATGASAAQAEKLDLDHRLHAGLHAALENAGEETVYYTADAGRIFDRILIKGRSAERDWTEALELVTWPRDRALPDPAAWYRAFPVANETPCPTRSEVLAQDATSLTFAVESAPCPAGAAFTGLYRVFYGKRTVYLAAGKLKAPMTADQRKEWLALLASAHVVK